MRKNILKVLEHGQTAEMIYMKNNGEISKRRIKVLSVDEDSFHAYCFLRDTKRTFRIENVLAFVPIVSREKGII